MKPYNGIGIYPSESAEKQMDVDRLLTKYVLQTCREVYRLFPAMVKASADDKPEQIIKKIVEFFTGAGASPQSVNILILHVLSKTAEKLEADGHSHLIPFLLNLGRGEVPEP